MTRLSQLSRLSCELKFILDSVGKRLLFHMIMEFWNGIPESLRSVGIVIKVMRDRTRHIYLAYISSPFRPVMQQI